MSSPKLEEEGVLREWAPLSKLLQQIPLRLRQGVFFEDVKFTCVDATMECIVLGTNCGTVFWYDRTSHFVQQLRPEKGGRCISSIKVVSTVDFMVAAGDNLGVVTIFKIPKNSDGNSFYPNLVEKIERYTVDGLHKSKVVALDWSINGQKLFSGDTNGVVVFTEMDFVMNLTKAYEIINEKISVVQLSYNQKLQALLVSTEYRCILYQKKSSTFTQVGQRERTSLLPLGGTFICDPSGAISIFSCRGGLKLWKANLDGSVQFTLLFKDALKKCKNEVKLLKHLETLKESVPCEFGKLFSWRDGLFVSFTKHHLLVIDPVQVSVVSCLLNAKEIVCVCTTRTELFVIAGARDLIRLGYTPDLCDSSLGGFGNMAQADCVSGIPVVSLNPVIGSPLSTSYSWNTYLSANTANAEASSSEVTYGHDPAALPPIVSIQDGVPELRLEPSRYQQYTSIGHQRFDDIIYSQKKPSKHKNRRKSAELSKSQEKSKGLSFNGVASYLNNIGKFLNGEFSPTICDGQLEESVLESVPKDILPDMRNIDVIVEDVARKEVLLDAMLESFHQEDNFPPFGGSNCDTDMCGEPSPSNNIETISQRIFSIELEKPELINDLPVSKIVPYESYNTSKAARKPLPGPVLQLEEVGDNPGKETDVLFHPENIGVQAAVPKSTDSRDGNTTASGTLQSGSVTQLSSLTRYITGETDVPAALENAREQAVVPVHPGNTDSCDGNTTASKTPHPDSQPSSPNGNITGETDVPAALENAREQAVVPVHPENTDSCDGNTTASETPHPDSQPSSPNGNITGETDVPAALENAREQAVVPVHPENTDSCDGNTTASKTPHPDSQPSSPNGNITGETDVPATLEIAREQAVVPVHPENTDSCDGNTTASKTPHPDSQPSSPNGNITGETDVPATLEIAREQAVVPVHPENTDSCDGNTTASEPPHPDSQPSSPNGNITSEISISEPLLSDDDANSNHFGYSPLPFSLNEDMSLSLRETSESFPYTVSNPRYLNGWSSMTCPDVLISLSSWSRGLVMCTPKLKAYVTSENAWSLLKYKAEVIIPSSTASIALKIHCSLAYYAVNWTDGTEWTKVWREVQHAAVSDEKIWFISNGELFFTELKEGVISNYLSQTSLSKVYSYNNGLIFISENGRIFLLEGEDWRLVRGIKNAKLLSVGPKQLIWAVDSKNTLFVTDNMKVDKTVWWQVPASCSKEEEVLSICSTEDAIYLAFKNSSVLQFNKNYVTGHRWIPAAFPFECTQITAGAVFEEKGCIWVLEKHNKLFALDTSLNILKEVVPPCNVVCIASAPGALWLLSDDGSVHLRQGITESDPVGVQWRKLNLEQLHSQIEMVGISCGPDVVWACDIRGKVIMLVGSPHSIANDMFDPAWVNVEGKPIDNNTFTKVYVGPDTYMVWALDNAGNIYVREAVFPTFPLGAGWVLVPDVKASHLTISSDAVYALNQEGVYKRIGISQNNYIGDAWLYLPVKLDSIAASFDLGLYGICSKTRNLVTHIEREFPLSDHITVEKDWALL